MKIANAMLTDYVRDLGASARRPRTVFISRARADIRFARPLEALLKTSQLRLIFDEVAPPSDRTIQSVIKDAIEAADLIIVLWSRAYAASKYCFDELDMALQRHQAGAVRLWILNLDNSDLVPPRARGFPSLAADSPEAVVEMVRKLLDG
ncbi:toll/interleukin-1 receptor domain-containing protein [Labedaea rhizosphaerae]|uniref:TIR domain-containing protein n=1 Tax=Labedaea rhizosphaerae TaxID=598644 RepID=A0A4R6SRC8_LABRH|nr:toll/interleukin-1 receptor domain-containing protein [Labedaea rhizosphaerae]TDQ05843.1 TIR domain-containing protein [Labedaea rhizosphaerae]